MEKTAHQSLLSAAQPRELYDLHGAQIKGRTSARGSKVNISIYKLPHGCV